MICKVKNTIERFSMLNNVKSVVIGLSGGADSVCLFDILLKFRAEYDFKLVAVHVNHNLRGNEALRDQNFVQELCSANNVELYVFSADVEKIAKEKHIGIEECGRNIRYEAFESMNCDRIAVAHNLSDCIESTVFNLVRGCSLSGICRIPPVRGKIIRPLIECSSEEIRSYCKNNSLKYVVDSTNLHDDYSRNYIRNDIVPHFSKLNQSFEESFLRFYDSVENDEEYLKKCSQRALKNAQTDNGFDKNKLLSEDKAIFYRCVRLMLESKMKKQVEKRHIDLVASAIKDGKTVELSKDLYISSDCDIIAFHSPNKMIEPWLCLANSKTFVSPFKTYELLFEPFDKTKHTGENNICDAAFLSDRLLMRSRKEGDSITLSKRKVSKTLKKLFNEQKIPPEERNKFAVLESDGKLIWAEPFGVNALFEVSNKTKTVAIIKIKEG